MVGFIRRWLGFISALIALTCTLLESGSVAEAAIVAQTGFNDATGIHSNGIVDGAPYGDGESILAVGAGAGEAGWTTDWFKAQANTAGGGVTDASNVLEGDLSLHLSTAGTSSANAAKFARRFTSQASGVVSFSVMLNVGTPFNSATALYLTGIGGTGPIANEPGPHAGVVQITAAGAVIAFGGDGLGGTVSTEVFADDTIQTGEWYQLEMSADLAAQTFTISLDGGTPSTALPFRHATGALPITAIDAFQISQNTANVSYDELVISSIPEPSSLIMKSVAVLAACPWIVNRRRKQLVS